MDNYVYVIFSQKEGNPKRDVVAVCSSAQKALELVTELVYDENEKNVVERYVNERWISGEIRHGEDSGLNGRWSVFFECEVAELDEIGLMQYM